jgi:hypothetical protein
MRIGKKAKGLRLEKPAVNNLKRNMLIVVIVAITVLLIGWVYTLGKKAEETVTVVMLNQNVYKNQLITEDMLKPYDMLKAEFEKYAVVDNGGQKMRRLVLWDEVDKVINTFAAYPLQKDTVLEYRSLIKSRIDNSDNVLYSFPGKEIVPLEVGYNELQAFKTFLKPGDRLNIEAIFSESKTITKKDEYGSDVTAEVEVFKTETVFKDIMIADLLNSAGESVLDIYSWYNDLSVYEQAELDNDPSFQERVEPTTLLVALTPEEKDRYYYYLSKDNIKFRVSMPQRVE